jgi:hypothetical protein
MKYETKDMRYELILETVNCDSFTNFPHTREGLTAAFVRISEEKVKDGFQSAKIVSDRDGEVFALDMSLAIN